MIAQSLQIGAHLPALQVVVPLLSAPVCALIQRPRVAWATALAVSVLALLMSAALLEQVLTDGPISYALGGWAAPWGLEYRGGGRNCCGGTLRMFRVFIGSSSRPDGPRDYLWSLTGASVAPARLRGTARRCRIRREPFDERAQGHRRTQLGSRTRGGRWPGCIGW